MYGIQIHTGCPTKINPFAIFPVQKIFHLLKAIEFCLKSIWFFIYSLLKSDSVKTFKIQSFKNFKTAVLLRLLFEHFAFWTFY